MLRYRRPTAGPFIVGVTGSVASGKSTFAAALGAAIADWPEHPSVETICTDGFLLPNAALETLGLLNRKGFPETYDVAGLRRALSDIRKGPAEIPIYSHVIYDIDPPLSPTGGPPDVRLVRERGVQMKRPGLAG